MMETLVAWIFTILVTIAPPSQRANSYIEEAQETEADALARYESIATDIVLVAYDADEKPILNVGPYSRAHSAVMIATTYYYEGGFRKDIDYGHGEWARGDGGKSWCMGQINLGKRQIKTEDGWIEDSARRTLEGWSGRDLVEDREKCVRVTRRILELSFGTCRSYNEGLAVYASGTCGSEAGKRISRERTRYARQVMGRFKPPFKDADALDAIALSEDIAD